MFDIDRHNDDRGNPAPNHSDSLTDGSIKAHKTISSHYTSDADTNTGRLQMQNKQVLGNDGTTNVTLYGYNQALGKWGFFVTQTGTEVTTNTDLSKFIFNSGQNVFKIAESGTVTVASTVLASAGVTNTYQSPTQQTLVNFTGTYTSPPAVIAFISSGQYTGSLLPSTEVQIGGTNGGISIYTLNISVDNTSLNVAAYYAAYGAYNFTGVSIAAQTVKYYVLQETAN